MINALFLKAPDERRQVSWISFVLRLYPGLATFGAASVLSFPSWGLLGHPCCSAAWPASLGSFADPGGTRCRCANPCLRKNTRNVPEAEAFHQMKPNVEAGSIKRWKCCCCGGSRGRSLETSHHVIECFLGLGRCFSLPASCPPLPMEVYDGKARRENTQIAAAG